MTKDFVFRKIWKQRIMYGVSSIMVAGVLLLFVMSMFLGVNFQARCKQAKLHYDGDCVEALVSLVDEI